jgi:putative sterol carrier protein
MNQLRLLGIQRPGTNQKESHSKKHNTLLKDIDMSSAAEFINEMNAKFNPAAAAGLDLVFQFNIEDADTYHLIVKDGTCEVVQGEAADPNVTLIMNSETLQGIVSGDLDGMMAFMSGQLKVEGDMMLATKLGELFPA